MKKSQRNKYICAGCMIGLLLALLACLVRTVFFPKDYNYYENRYANKVVAFNTYSVMDTSFQDSLEDALADQIFLSQLMERGYNFVVKNTLNPWVDKILQKYDDIYIPYFGMSLFNEHIVYRMDDFSAIKASLDDKAQNYNAIIAENPDVEFYAYYIEKDTDIDFETNEKAGSSEYILSLLDIKEGNSGIFEINDYAEFNKYFYKTDHHWNHCGSYKAYLDLVAMLQCGGVPITCDEEAKVMDVFEGSKTATVGSHLIQDVFYGYSFDFPEYVIFANGTEVSNYGNQEALLPENYPDGISYSAFYGLDFGEIIFDSGVDDRENILIIGESFDNAILKLLASHFHRTYSIDLRYYAHYMGQSFDIDQYIVENSIDKVLFIGNNGFYCGYDFMLE